MNISRIKTVKRGFVMFLAIIAMILSSNLPNAIAGDYLGEFCWLFQQTEDEHGPMVGEPSLMMRSAVTHMGGAYYALQGYVTIPSDNPFMLNGFAVIIGNEVSGSLHTSQDHTPFKNYRDGGTMEVRLNLSTLSGTWWGTCYSFNKSSHVSDLDCYGAGTMTITSCP